MKFEGKVASFVIDEKRFKLPGVKLVGKCPKCGAEHRRDFVRDPLVHPTANEPADVHCYCGKCDHEWWVSAVLHVSLELAAPRDGSKQRDQALREAREELRVAYYDDLSAHVSARPKSVLDALGTLVADRLEGKDNDDAIDALCRLRLAARVAKKEGV